MYAGVPTTSPVVVSAGSRAPGSAQRAMPKSTSLTCSTLPPSRRTLLGAEPLGDAGGHGRGLAQREAAPEQANLQVLAVEPLHGEEALAERGDAVADVADDARVLEVVEHLGLAVEARRVGRAVGAHDLERDDLTGQAVDRAKHGAHGAGPHDPLHLEALGLDAHAPPAVPGYQMQRGDCRGRLACARFLAA